MFSTNSDHFCFYRYKLPHVKHRTRILIPVREKAVLCKTIFLDVF
jgi:hypothetical protein